MDISLAPWRIHVRVSVVWALFHNKVALQACHVTCIPDATTAWRGARENIADMYAFTLYGVQRRQTLFGDQSVLIKNYVD